MFCNLGLGGRLKKKNREGFCFLSRKVYINNFPSRPSVLLLQTTTAFVSQILLHVTFNQSSHISSSPREKEAWNTTAWQSCPQSLIQSRSMLATLCGHSAKTSTQNNSSYLIMGRENSLNESGFVSCMEAATHLICIISFLGFSKILWLIPCFHKGAMRRWKRSGQIYIFWPALSHSTATASRDRRLYH